MAGVDAGRKVGFATENVVWILGQFTKRDVTVHRALLYDTQQQLDPNAGSSHVAHEEWAGQISSQFSETSHKFI